MEKFGFCPGSASARTLPDMGRADRSALRHPGPKARGKGAKALLTAGVGRHTHKEACLSILSSPSRTARKAHLSLFVPWESPRKEGTPALAPFHFFLGTPERLAALHRDGAIRRTVTHPLDFPYLPGAVPRPLGHQNRGV